LLGAGPEGAFSSRINALTVWNDQLYAAGIFSAIGSSTVNRIAKWDGLQWTGLGDAPDAGLDRLVTSLAPLGGNLYVGGFFNSAGGKDANFLARWDGQDWHPVGGSGGGAISGGNTILQSVVASRDSLFIGGNFRSIEGEESENFAIFTPRKELTALPECGVVQDVPTGQSADSETFTVLNFGISDIEIQAIRLEGADSEDFRVAPGSDSCTGSTLKADQTCELQIRFTPSSNGVKRANVLVDSDANIGPNPIEVVSSSGVVHFDGFEQDVCQ